MLEHLNRILVICNLSDVLKESKKISYEMFIKLKDYLFVTQCWSNRAGQAASVEGNVLMTLQFRTSMCPLHPMDAA